MFVLAIPLAEKILRPIVVYFFLVIGLRLAGKRELAQLNPFDLVVLLTLSNTVQNAIIGDDNSVTGGIIGAATLLLVNYLVVRFLYRHEKLDRIVEGDTAHCSSKMERFWKTSWRKKFSRIQELRSGRAQTGIRQTCRKWIAPCSSQAAQFRFVGKKPAPDETRHQELLERLDQLTEEVATLRLRPLRQRRDGDFRHRRAELRAVARLQPAGFRV